MKYTKLNLKKKTQDQLIKIILQIQHNINNLEILNSKIEEGKSYTIADGTKGMVRGDKI